jgi:hypothetical protein
VEAMCVRSPPDSFSCHIRIKSGRSFSERLHRPLVASGTNSVKTRVYERFLRMLHSPPSYRRIRIHRSLLGLQCCCQRSKYVDERVQIEMIMRPVVMDAFHIQEVVAIDASLTKRIVSVDGIGASFATVTHDCGRVCPYVWRIASPGRLLLSVNACFIAWRMRLTGTRSFSRFPSLFPHPEPHSKIMGFFYAIPMVKTPSAGHAIAHCSVDRGFVACGGVSDATSSVRQMLAGDQVYRFRDVFALFL